MNEILILSPVKAMLTINHLIEVIFMVVHKLTITELKPKPCKAIVSYVTGSDTFVVLPTGYGQSLIYAIFPLICNKIRGTIKCFFISCVCFL